MTITLKIDNPHLEQELKEFLTEQKQCLEEVTIEALRFFINAFKRNQKIDIDLESKKERKEFQELSNQSLVKIWDNKEDEIYDRFLG